MTTWMFFFLNFKQRGYTPSTEKEAVPASDEDAITDIMEQHGQFVGSIQSRLSKLQVIYDEKVESACGLWECHS